MKLIHKLIIGFLLIALMIWVTGFFAITISKETLQEHFMENANILADDLLDKLDRNVYRKIEILQGYASDDVLRTMIIQSNEEFESMENVSSYLSEKDREWTALGKEEISPFIQSIMNNTQSDKLRKQVRFYEEKYGHKVFGEVFVTNKYGANIAQTGKTSDYRQDDEEWWQAAMRETLYLKDVAYDTSANMYSVDIAVGIQDEKDNFIGVIKAILNVEELVNIARNEYMTAEHKHHKYMHIQLVNREGKLIYSTKEGDRFMDNVSHLLPSEHSSSAQGDMKSDVSLRTETDGMLITHAHSSGYREYDGLGWILIMEHKKEEIFAPAVHLRNRILTISLGVTILAVIMGLTLSAYITKSFTKLKEYTLKIGKGDLNARINVKSRDEIGQLARAFKKMTEDLRTTTVARDELAEEINRRESVEKMMHDSEERFRSVAESANDAIIYIDDRGEIIFWNTASESIFGHSAEEIVGRNVRIIIPERFDSAYVRRIMNQSGSENAQVKGKTAELSGRRKDGEEFPIELSISPWKIQDETYFTVIIRDVSSRKHAQEIIRHQLGRLNALRSIDRAIIGSLDMSVTLDVFLSQVTAQLRIDATSVLLLNKHTQMLEYVVSKGFRSGALKYTRLRLGESNAGRAAIERRIVTIPNLKEYLDGFASSELFTREDFVTYIAVPLIAKGQVKGVLELFHRSPLHYEPEWLEFLEAIADQGAIAIDNSTMFDDLQRSNIELSLAYDTTIEGWSRALDLRDKETEGHSQRVTELTVQIAREFQMKNEDMAYIRWGALLHDIGKMGIPDSILLKPGKLTDDEWKIMKLHPVYARDLLYPIEHLRPAIDIPYYHHERWDGKGYPEGLKGEKIPLTARIFAVVDVWDALTSDRPYRPAWSQEKTREHIISQVGTHFDAGVIEVFLGMDSMKTKSKTDIKALEGVKIEKT